jgi:hypothetical protein
MNQNRVQWTSFVFVLLNLQILTLSQSLRLSSNKWNDDRWMINYKGCGKKQLWPNFNVLSSHVLRDWRKPQNPQSEQLVSGQRFEHGTSRIWSRSVNHLTMMFGVGLMSSPCCLSAGPQLKTIALISTLSWNSAWRWCYWRWPWRQNF